MKEIKLTHGKLALVDDEDYEKINQFKWHACRSKKKWYARRSVQSGDGKRIKIHMHREILNAPPGTQGDHRNGNSLDNQKHNLRPCARHQNMSNQMHPHCDNKLKIKGVTLHKKNKKFVATIQVNKERIYLGSFNVLGDADSAYRIAEAKYFGEFARAV